MRHHPIWCSPNDEDESEASAMVFEVPLLAFWIHSLRVDAHSWETTLSNDAMKSSTDFAASAGRGSESL
jgi:hypothetical protein